MNSAPLVCCMAEQNALTLKAVSDGGLPPHVAPSRICQTNFTLSAAPQFSAFKASLLRFPCVEILPKYPGLSLQWGRGRLGQGSTLGSVSNTQCALWLSKRHSQAVLEFGHQLARGNLEPTSWSLGSPVYGTPPHPLPKLLPLPLL